MMLMNDKNTYVFEVDHKSNKILLKDEIEKMYSVKIININVLNRKPKKIRRGRITGTGPARKLAYVTLQAGDQIKEIQALF